MENTEKTGTNQRQGKLRDVFRFLGPVFLVASMILMIITFVDFFNAIGGVGQTKFFWCFYLAIPAFVIGAVMTKFGY